MLCRRVNIWRVRHQRGLSLEQRVLNSLLERLLGLCEQYFLTAYTFVCTCDFRTRGAVSTRYSPPRSGFITSGPSQSVTRKHTASPQRLQKLFTERCRPAMMSCPIAQILGVTGHGTGTGQQPSVPLTVRIVFSEALPRHRSRPAPCSSGHTHEDEATQLPPGHDSRLPPQAVVPLFPRR